MRLLSPIQSGTLGRVTPRNTSDRASTEQVTGDKNRGLCDPEALGTAPRVLHRVLHCRFPAGDTNRGCTGRGQGQQSRTATVCGRAVSSQDRHYPPLRLEASSRLLMGDMGEPFRESPGTGAGSGRVRQPIRRGDGERHGGSDGTGRTRHGYHAPRRDRGDQGKTAGDQRRSEIRATIEWPLTAS
jgi:hypothetical protein